MDLLMAIDLGSTSLKAVVCDLDGNIVSSASRPTEKVHPRPDRPEWVVWDPDQIWRGSAAAAKEAVGRLDDASSVKAVAVTGMGMDGVPVDEKGEHLYPFISWHDPRTAAQAEWWSANVGRERTFAVTGFPAWAVTGAMRILWMKENEPEVMSRAAKWLLIEDFLNHRLCGQIATDYSMASCMLLLDQAGRRWSDELLEASGIARALLPEPRQSGTPLGEVTPEAAELTGLRAGTPVVLGGHDHICGTIPVGAYRPGTLFDVIGTWESVIATVDAAVLTPQVRDAGVCVQSHVAPGMYAAWGGAPAGESLEWFRAQLAGGADSSWEALLAGLGGTKPGSSGVMYLPHISAAGCPVGDNKAMGAFVGISGAAGRADMLRAVIEGINYQFLDIMRALESALGAEFGTVTVSGGATRNEFWVRNKADMIGFAVQVSEVAEATPVGAAVLAGLGVGLYRDLDEAYARVGRPGTTYEPRRELTELYAECYETYRMLYPALKGVSHRIFERFKG